MNKAVLIGNLATDPELRKTTTDISVCTFRLAVQRRFPNQQGVREADFFNIVCWRQLADLCVKFLAKGRKCAITGPIQNRSYEAQDGNRRWVTEIVADEVEFLSAPQGQGAGQSFGQEAPPPEPPSGFDGGTGFSQVDDDDDLPF